MHLSDPMAMSLGEFVATNRGYVAAQGGQRIKPPSVAEFERAVYGTVH